MKIIYIGKTEDSINYFKSLIDENERYSLVGTYLFTDDYKEVINQDKIDCVVVDMSIDDCQDISFMRYIRDIDPFIIAYGNVEVNWYITYTINSDLTYMAFLDNKSSKIKLNAYLSSLCENVIEFNVSEFFDCYINDNSIVFDDEELERFVAYLTCRRLKIQNADEVLRVLYPREKNETKLKMIFHQLCLKFHTFLDQIGLGYLFNYNATRCIFNYHLVESDFYKILDDEPIDFDKSYMDSFKINFMEKIAHDAEHRGIRTELDLSNDIHDVDESYIPLIEPSLDDELNLSNEDGMSIETSFLDKAMQNDNQN